MISTNGFARLPTFTEVIDTLLAGVGLIPNTEKQLAELAQYDRRVDLFSGHDGRKGRMEQLLLLLAGEDKDLQMYLADLFSLVEEMIAQYRNVALHTDASYEQGIDAFLNHLALPLTAGLLRDADRFAQSPLWFIKHLVCSAADSKSDVLTAWKKQIRSLLPPEIKAPCFRNVISKASKQSRRKLDQIEQDINELTQEIDCDSHSESHDLVTDVRASYLAGMATMRLLSMAPTNWDERRLVERLTQVINSTDDIPDPIPRIRYSVCHVDCPALIDQLFESTVWDDEALNATMAEAVRISTDRVFSHYLPAVAAYQHLSRNEFSAAAEQLHLIVGQADLCQMGKVAEWASSMLIATNLHVSPPKKNLALNPLVGLRIDSIAQRLTIEASVIPTPFSLFSDRPNLSSYNLHLLESIQVFLRHPRSPGVAVPGDFLGALDMALASYMQQAGGKAKLPHSERSRLILPGIAIHSYELIRDIYFYFTYLWTPELPETPHINRYLQLSDDDKCRILCFIDPIQFDQDNQRYTCDAQRRI